MIIFSDFSSHNIMKVFRYLAIKKIQSEDKLGLEMTSVFRTYFQWGIATGVSCPKKNLNLLSVIIYLIFPLLKFLIQIHLYIRHKSYSNSSGNLHGLL